MARKPRIQYPGAVYHVMCRGDRQQRIVEDNRDRSRFVDTLAEVCERTGWLIHSYALMTNHYHLLLETPEANLVAGMKWFQGTYTCRFNHRHQVSGHLFQGRYKALHIDPEEAGHFLTVSTYIHLNPVRGGLATDTNGSVDLSTYEWSSYRSFLQPISRRPDWLEVGRVLGELGLRDSIAGRRQYARYMSRRVRESTDGELADQWAPIRRGWMLGSDEFRERLLDEMDKQIGARRRASYHGEAISRHDEHTAEQLLRAGLIRLKIDESELGSLPKREPRKQLLAWWIHKRTMIHNAWLAERLHMGHVTAVSKSISAVDASDDPTWRKGKRMLERMPRITD